MCVGNTASKMCNGVRLPKLCHPRQWLPCYQICWVRLRRRDDNEIHILCTWRFDENHTVWWISNHHKKEPPSPFLLCPWLVFTALQQPGFPIECSERDTYGRVEEKYQDILNLLEITASDFNQKKYLPKISNGIWVIFEWD